MNEKLQQLTDKQQLALQKLRVSTRDVLKDNTEDEYLLRWLRARNFDLRKSESMLRDSLKWRRLQKVDNIIEEWIPPEALRKYYPGGICGTDREGYPVFFDTLGTIDLKGMAQAVKRSDIVKYRVWWMERVYQEIFPVLSKNMGKKIDQVTMVFDMDGIGIKHMWKPAIDTMNQLLHVTEQNYPETLRSCYIVNAPRIFPILYNLVKYFLSEDTKRKIKVLGGDWKERLVEAIDPQELPKQWGGELTDPDGDPACRSKVCMGGDIPTSYYIPMINAEDLEAFTEAVVNRASTLQLDYQVNQPMSIIRWQFHSEGNDLGFGLFLRTADSRQKAAEMTEIVPSSRVDCHVIPEEGSHTCTAIGTYVVRFDNTYSWLRAKTVRYLIEILPPAEENVDEIEGAGNISVAL